MAKAKSKEFILLRISNLLCRLYSLKGTHLISLCYRNMRQWFGIKLEVDEKKRVRITIEEVK